MSDVWKFWKKDGRVGTSDSDWVKCQLCDKRQKQSHGSTSNMRHHLKQVHLQEYMSPAGYSDIRVSEKTKSKLLKFADAGAEDSPKSTQGNEQLFYLL